MDDGVANVDDPEQIARLRQKSRQIRIQALVGAVLITAVMVLW